jgi:hypothetical protein
MSNKQYPSDVLKHDLVVHNILTTSFLTSVKCQLILLDIGQMGITKRSDLLFA